MTAGADPAARRRFFAAPEALDADPIIFAPQQVRHIARVLRLRPGARIAVFDGRREVGAELLVVSETAVTARRIGSPRTAARPLDLILLQGLARGPKMDLIVRTLTEIGASAVHPVLTERSLADPGPARLARWRRIAQEASGQCGRADVPAIHPPAPLGEALDAAGPVDLLVVPWEQARQPIGAVIAGRAFASAAVLIGPEGGLTAAEVEVARAAGGETASLGPLILRTETAGLVTAAMLLYERLLR